MLSETMKEDENSKRHVIVLRWICRTAGERERERKSYFVSLQTLYHWKGTDTTSIYWFRKTRDNYKMMWSRKLSNSNPGHENVIARLLESCQSCLYQKIPLRSLFRSLFFMNAATLQTYRHIFKTQQESAAMKGTTFAWKLNFLCAPVFYNVNNSQQVEDS